MRHWRSSFLFLSCFLTFSNAHAQTQFKNVSTTVQGFYGSYLTHLPKAQYLRDSYSYFGEVALQQQTDGAKQWHRANGLPQVGVGAFFGNTGSKQYMGSMAGVFPFVRWKLYGKGNVSSHLRAGAGFGWIQKHYDKLSNHKSVMIGTHGNAYINFLWQHEVRLFSNVHINASFSFLHFSNGSSTLPNLGLNIPALVIGVRYQTTKQEKASTPALVKDTFKTKNALYLYTTAGIKQFPWIESKRYVANTANIEWSRQFRPSGKYSGGVYLFYDRALEVDPAGIPDQKRKGNKVQAGVFAGYEHLFGKLSLPVQLGVYAYNRDIYPILFQQLGFRYRINKHWTTQLLMKTHTGKADFIHLGIGYRIQ